MKTSIFVKISGGIVIYLVLLFVNNYHKEKYRPKLNYFNNSVEVVGAYDYQEFGKSRSVTTINDRNFYCGADFEGAGVSCLHKLRELPSGAVITAKLTILKTETGDVPLATSVVYNKKEVFNIKPEEYENMWSKSSDLSPFGWPMLIVAFYWVIVFV